MGYKRHDEIAPVTKEHPTIVTILGSFRTGKYLVNETVDMNQTTHLNAREMRREESMVSRPVLIPKSANLFLGGDDEINCILHLSSINPRLPILFSRHDFEG